MEDANRGSMMKTQYYKKARRAGYRSAEAWRIANTMAEADEHLVDKHDEPTTGSIRLIAEPECENYFDVYGLPEAYTNANGRRVSAKQATKEMEDLLERNGCYYVASEVFDGEDWVHADSIGMIVENRPTDWGYNPYVPHLLRAALDAREAILEDSLRFESAS
jgi:hypothetical protein